MRTTSATTSRSLSVKPHATRTRTTRWTAEDVTIAEHTGEPLSKHSLCALNLLREEPAAPCVVRHTVRQGCPVSLLFVVSFLLMVSLAVSSCCAVLRLCLVCLILLVFVVSLYCFYIFYCICVFCGCLLCRLRLFFGVLAAGIVVNYGYRLSFVVCLCFLVSYGAWGFSCCCRCFFVVSVASLAGGLVSPFIIAAFVSAGVVPIVLCVCYCYPVVVDYPVVLLLLWCCFAVVSLLLLLVSLLLRWAVAVASVLLLCVSLLLPSCFRCWCFILLCWWLRWRAFCFAPYCSCCCPAIVGCRCCPSSLLLVSCCVLAIVVLWLFV